MTVKSFFVDALTSALDLGIATPDDVIKHVTPDVLSIHLPRPLWARLLTACIGAPKVDAQLLVETIGVSNLCEHIPSPIVWGLLAEVGARALGNAIPEKPIVAAAAKSEPTKTAPTKATPATGVPTTPTTPSATASGAIKRPLQPTPPKPLPVASPPPVETKTSIQPAPPPPGPSIPAPGQAPAEDDARAPRPRTPTGQRFRQTNTNIGRLAANQRRPQANVATEPSPTVPAASTTPRRPARPETEVEVDVETEAGSSDWRTAIAIEDDQLVDWSASEETQTTDEASIRKR